MATGVKVNKRWRLYGWLLLIQSVYSLVPWFFWWLPSRYAAILFFLINAIYLLTSTLWDFKDGRRMGAALIVVFLFQYQAIGGNIVYHIIKFCDSIALLPLIFLKTQYQKDLLDRFQKILAPILAISLFFWIGHLAGFDLPSSEITYGSRDRGMGDDAQYYFSNHYLYLVNQGLDFQTEDLVPSFLRFSSVFLEPGYLAILMVFFLFINEFNFRNWKCIVFAFTILFTLSLAGFLMTLIAFGAHLFQKSKHRIAGIVSICFLLFFGYYFFTNYNGGDNLVNYAIIQRLEYDDDTGTIAGYNRTSEYFDDRFDQFILSSDALFGINREGYSKAFGDLTNVGYKVYIMTHGLFGLFLFLLFLFLLARLCNNLRSFVLMLLYIIMFMRGHHTMWYFGFVLVYICGIIDTRYKCPSEVLNEKTTA